MINYLRDKAIRLQNKFVLISNGCLSERKMERGDQIVEVLGIIIVAVVILFIFKDKVSEIFNNIMGTVFDKLKALFGTGTSNLTPPTP